MAGTPDLLIRVWVFTCFSLAIFTESEAIKYDKIFKRLHDLRETVAIQQELIGSLSISTSKQAKKLVALKRDIQTLVNQHKSQRHDENRGTSFEKYLQGPAAFKASATGSKKRHANRNANAVSTPIGTPAYRYQYQRIAFYAMQYPQQTVPMNGVVHFDYVQTNFRKTYDVIRSVFMSPLRGLYLFSVSIASLVNSRCKAELVKNGIGLGVVLADSVRSKTDIDQGSITAVLSLDEGDEVWVRGLLPTQTIAGDRDTMFSGALIRELE